MSSLRLGHRRSIPTSAQPIRGLHRPPESMAPDRPWSPNSTLPETPHYERGPPGNRRSYRDPMTGTQLPWGRERPDQQGATKPSPSRKGVIGDGQDERQDACGSITSADSPRVQPITEGDCPLVQDHDGRGQENIRLVEKPSRGWTLSPELEERLFGRPAGS